MDTTTQTPVVDADIIETEQADQSAPVAATTDEPNGGQVLIDLENLIKSHIAGIDQRKRDLKTQREMLTSALENDETYREHDKLAKEAAKVRAKTKSHILSLASNKPLVEKVKELAQEVKEMDEALSDYLREYMRMSGVNEIETDDGDIREIIYIAKLIKKGSGFGK